MIWNILYIFAGIVLITIGILLVNFFVDVTEEDHEQYYDNDN